MKTERELFNEWLKYYEKHDVVIDQLQRAFMWQAWQASANREGYKFAPVEANEDMVCAAIDVWISDKSNTYEEMYKAMINAI